MLLGIYALKLLDDKRINRFLKSIRTGFYVLLILRLLLVYGHLYGYKIRMLIIERTGGVLKPSESTIYESLKLLEKNGFIKSYWAESLQGPPRKYYEITSDGRRLFELLMSEVSRLYRALEEINLEGGGSAL